MGKKASIGVGGGGVDVADSFGIDVEVEGGTLVLIADLFGDFNGAEEGVSESVW